MQFFNLDCKYFSGYLYELAEKGEDLPPTLPQNLIPPSQRKGGVVMEVSGTSGGGVGTTPENGRMTPPSFDTHCHLDTIFWKIFQLPSDQFYDQAQWAKIS